ncbi:hypothetical protein PR202_gb12380 [Eleusine coracana subsp. coracana]|uniref:Uncharacterized protein n=1 Tax=Eleusine coracana subsp. coracana TaxID=191504 RepID=A0AAV5EQ91_ELECO|nr:hypothetical protein PR202_gb12380 [Eleusine coracana subsp. coracana]
MPKLETLLNNFDSYEKSIIGVEHLTSLKEVQLTGNMQNPTLCSALIEQLKAESDRRPRSNRFQVVVRYD